MFRVHVAVVQKASRLNVMVFLKSNGTALYGTVRYCHADGINTVEMLYKKSLALSLQIDFF